MTCILPMPGTVVVKVNYASEVVTIRVYDADIEIDEFCSNFSALIAIYVEIAFTRYLAPETCLLAIAICQ